MLVASIVVLLRVDLVFPDLGFAGDLPTVVLPPLSFLHLRHTLKARSVQLCGV